MDSSIWFEISSGIKWFQFLPDRSCRRSNCGLFYQFQRQSPLNQLKIVMSEFHFQDNKKPNNNTSTTCVLGSDMMLQHQNHHHRPFSSDHDDSSTIPYGYGPTSYIMSFGGDSDSSALDATTIDNSGVPLTLQPFHNISATTALKPSVTAVGIAASSGSPFTYAQWKELERQAMIYKYLGASLPVPSELLSLDPSFNKKSSSRNRSNNDPEEGRCRRTDGKKWRCSREVAPNNKYCDRHMHRGRSRPRSRKHVELHTNDNSHNQIKKTVAMPNSIIRTYGGSSSHFHASTGFQPYQQTFLCLENNGFVVKTQSFDFLNKQPRGLEWMQNGDPIYLGASNSGWHSLIHNNRLGLTNESSYQNNTEFQYMNSFPLYTTSELSQQEKPFSLFFNPLTVPMQTLQYEKLRDFSFIDAWSNAETVENIANTNNNVSATSIGNFSLSSLDLPMGGPLGEVLRQSTVTSISATNSNPCSPVGINHVESIGTSGTGMFSSPSGVLHLSDSSGNSSPTIASSKGQF